MKDTRYDLQEASRASGIVEDELRRQIEIGDLPAERLPGTDRYLVEGLYLGLPDRNPKKRLLTRKRCIIAFVLVFLNVAYLESCHSYSMNYGCTNCGRSKHASEYRILGETYTLKSDIVDTDLTAMIGAESSEACSHSWFFWNGSGGGAV